VLDKLKQIESLGGEGLMLRKPASYAIHFFCELTHSWTAHDRQYEGRRSGTLLKIKVHFTLPYPFVVANHFVLRLSTMLKLWLRAMLLAKASTRVRPVR
jgi:hypothetical protein